ncbi:Lysophospholipase [Trichophyton interdigitale]|uniref:Lysophospholipase n=1 Tax=Trichophyton interdigitale TaxID=101480 RepID=A0A9P5CYE5_9EURO|nr:Lysophospholipase [Trichophyton interdigitale]KAF3898158.1 Lysophospholipase [Trichophyton interdigitale]KAG8211646.1 Lysophospholipase [Trichophyton interdigitale]
MGAARFLQARWRQALKGALFVSGSASIALLGKQSVRCDAGRSTAVWNAKKTPQTPEESALDKLVKSGVKPGEKENKDDAGAGGDAEPKSAWETMTDRLGTAEGYFSSSDWSADWSAVFKDYISPGWTFFSPDILRNLQRELSMAPGSVADDVWKEACDPSFNPSIVEEASVRIGGTLCPEEEAFLSDRRKVVARNLASYLGVPEDEVHPDDVPVIAMCASGGGLRALIAGTGSYMAAKEAGLWDCLTYTAGVSGSCWLQTLFNSSIGGQDFGKMIDHLKARLHTHIAFPPEALDILTTPPTNKYLLRGVIEKLKGDPKADFGLVDVYGILLAARLMVPQDTAALNDSDLQLSSQRAVVKGGANPMPIYTAVRHEIPKPSKPGASEDELEEISKRESWFQWFEFTPYELFCEELAAGIPTWAVGRNFKNGKGIAAAHGYAVPELRVPALMGVWGSAFCATLAHYYREIRPAFMGLAGFSSIDALIEGKSEDLTRVHPIDPATVPNFVLGMEGKLPDSCPDSVFQDSHLRLMDAGMSNNLPIYPLLRPGRNVDLIVAFDVSADSKEANWLSVVDGYAHQRGIKGWPIGAGWPKSNASPEETADIIAEEAQLTKEEADKKVAAAQKASKGRTPDSRGNDPDLTFCNIWLGTTEERISSAEPPPSKRLFHEAALNEKDSEFHLTQPHAGIAVAYFPLLPNPACLALPDPDKDEPDAERKILDPLEEDYLSTWNFIYTAEQIDSAVHLAKCNFSEGEDQLKRVVRGIYERKKRERLQREKDAARTSTSYLA